MNLYNTVEVPLNENDVSREGSHPLNETTFLTSQGNMVTKGRITIPLQGYDDSFVFKVWVQLSVEELQNLSKQDVNPSGKGILLVDLPFYGSMKGTDVKVRFDGSRKDFREPDIIMLDKKGNNIFIHQHYGLPKLEYQSWMEALKNGDVRQLYPPAQ